MKQLALKNLARRPGVMLVPVDQQFSIIDPIGERVLIINSAAAWVWTRLGSAEVVPENRYADVSGFIRELEQLGLTVASERSSAGSFVGELAAAPRIEAQSALQVAANNSGAMADPFA